MTADYFTRNPDNSEAASNKTLSLRTSWDIRELTKETDAAAVEKDVEKRIIAHAVWLYVRFPLSLRMVCSQTWTFEPCTRDRPTLARIVG